MNNQLFNQLLNRGYRITFTSSQVMYTTPEGVSKTLQYAGDPDDMLQAISNGLENKIPDEATLGLWNQIVGNFKNPWAAVLQLTCPLDGGLVKVGPIQPLSQIKDLSIVFENVSNVRTHGDALIQQLQLNGIQTAWVLHAQYPTLLAMTSGFCPTGNSSGMPFGVY